MLHIFGTVTEIKIENAVERAIDRIDADLMTGLLTQDEYDELSDRIGDEASALYRQHVTPFHHFPGVKR